MGFSNAILGGASKLIRNAIQSPNYVPATSGWSINKDGSAEFNDGTFRVSVSVQGSDGSYVKVQTSGGHADILMRPETLVGSNWDPAQITAAIGDPGGIYPTNPALYLVAPADDGTTTPPAQFVLIGPQDASDLSPAQLATNIFDVFGTDGWGASPGNAVMTVYGSLFCHNFAVTGGIGERQFQIQTADLPIGSTTLTNTDLSFDVLAGATYEYRVRGAYDAPTATDAKLAWTTPATTIADKLIDAPDLGTTTNIATSGLKIRRAMTTAQAIGAPNSVANGFTTYREDGLIVPSANGTCTLQFAASGVGTATWRANSWVIAERVA